MDQDHAKLRRTAKKPRHQRRGLHNIKPIGDHIRAKRTGGKSNATREEKINPGTRPKRATTPTKMPTEATGARKAA
jgi:hypothetical protein